MAFWNGEEQSKTKDKASPIESGKSAGEPERRNEIKEPPMRSSSEALVSPRDLPHQVRSALGAGTEIDGKLRFDAAVSIDGKLCGEIFSSEALIVGKSGRIDAQINVKRLVIYGVVRGSVKAERIDLLSGGLLEGDIECPTLSIEAGAVFIGNSKMIKSEETRIIVDPKVKVEPKKISVEQKKEDKPKDPLSFN